MSTYAHILWATIGDDRNSWLRTLHDILNLPETND